MPKTEFVEGCNNLHAKLYNKIYVYTVSNTKMYKMYPSLSNRQVSPVYNQPAL